MDLCSQLFSLDSLTSPGFEVLYGCKETGDCISSTCSVGERFQVVGTGFATCCCCSQVNSEDVLSTNLQFFTFTILACPGPDPFTALPFSMKLDASEAMNGMQVLQEDLQGWEGQTLDCISGHQLSTKSPRAYHFRVFAYFRGMIC